MTPTDLASLPKGELLKLERAIARRHSGHFPWFMVIWAYLNMAVWLSLWPLVIGGFLPLWAAFPIALVNMVLVYLPTHDAQHDIIGRPGTPTRWFNEFLGHSTSWMLATPFLVLRHTHLEHHKHANDPALDPDHTTSAPSGWAAIWRSIRQKQPDSKRAIDYAACLERLNRTDLMLQAAAYEVGFVAILCVLAWSGCGLEAFFLWWLPLRLGLIHIDYYLSWAPHHPAQERGRYRDTRAFRSRMGNIWSLGMQYHIVHHLHPYIPLNRNPAAFREMRPIIEARGCRIDGL
jgi:beta-carotene hydroxylase